ncbi:putative WD repeat-containing protein, partial [Naja naja]
VPRGKEAAIGSKESKSHVSGVVSMEPTSILQNQRRLQDHGKEKKEFGSKITFQVAKLVSCVDRASFRSPESGFFHIENYSFNLALLPLLIFNCFNKT